MHPLTMRLLIPLLAPLLACSIATAQADESHPSASAAGKMRLAASEFLATLPPALKADAMRTFDDAERFDWHFTPRTRQGVSLQRLDARQRAAIQALLKQALSAAGLRRVANIIELELVLREMETFGALLRDPDKYHLTIYGMPNSRAPWGWCFEGHHLSLNFTLAGDRMAVDTPSFFGANPAEVKSGPKQGLRALEEEEDEARALLKSLTPEQLGEAVIGSRTYGDIVTGASAQANPLDDKGIASAKLNPTQRAQLQKLIGVHAGNFEPGLAAARMLRVSAGGEANIRFAWSGATARGKPFYYRIQGPLFLIELDSSQNNGNHIHTVWRDFKGDFGRDLLRAHYALADGSSHKH